MLANNDDAFFLLSLSLSSSLGYIPNIVCVPACMGSSTSSLLVDCCSCRLGAGDVFIPLMGLRLSGHLLLLDDVVSSSNVF